MLPPSSIQASFHEPIQLFWEGTPFAHHSLSRVNRELALALLRRRELDLTLLPYEKDQFDPLSMPRYASLTGYLTRNKIPASQGPRIWVRHQYPLRQFPPPRAAWVIYHPCEHTRISVPMVELMGRASEVWTKSKFSVDAMVRSGVPVEKIQLIPNGIAPDIFHPHGARAELPAAKPFRFLFVGGTIYRKGVDILLKAYGKAFTSADPVSLIIKDFGVDQIYHGQTGEDRIRAFTQNPDYPEVIHLTDQRSEEEMAELYRACDVFVSSYRGEGFCSPPLEAMACGLPVIVTQGGSTDDFVAPASGWRIPAEFRSVGSKIYGEPVDGEAHLLEPNADALIQLLREAFSDMTSRLARGKAAAQAALDWTWDHTAEKIVVQCQSLDRARETKSSAL